jgi:hypothetical protein
MSDITISISTELTRLMILRCCSIKDRTRALELAIELHDIIAKCVELFRAKRKPGAVAIADFALAVWQQTLERFDLPKIIGDGETVRISDELRAICDDALFQRWLMVSDTIAGLDAVSRSITKGAVH